MTKETEVKTIPKGLHAAEHQNGGIDEVNVVGLTGLLADDQHVLDAEVRAVSAELFIAETEVHNAAAPIAWTDLDLSAVVGANPALVMLKFAEVANASAPIVAVRKNGDVDQFYQITSQGVAVGKAQQNSAALTVLLVATDVNGIIEWTAQAAGAMTVDVMAFIR